MASQLQKPSMNSELPMSNAAGIRLNLVSVLAIFAVLAAPLRAQDRKVPSINTTTRLVQLNVVVLDDHRRPVSNLSQNDFEVFDNGREQKLSHFSVSSSPAGTRPAAAPLVVTNRSGQPGETPGTVIIVLVDETMNQDIQATYYRTTLQSARLQVLKFLRTLRPGEQVALYALRAEGVVVMQDLTDDSAALLAAAKTIGTGQLRAKISPVGAKLMAETARAKEDWLASGEPLTAPKTSLTEDLRRELVKEAFKGIGHHLQGNPARKNVVWISPKFPSMTTGLDPKLMLGERDAINPIPGAMLPVPEFANTESQYEQSRVLARQMSNANISVYPMDAKALGTGSVVNMQGERNFMDLLASETGGRAFYDTNALDEHLREVVEEGSTAYLLGYYPGDSTWDNKYHKVEVKLRRAGLSVFCRKGYFASDEPQPRDSDTALRDAAKGMLERSGIGVTLNVSSNPLEWFQQEVVVKLETQEIHFENTGGRWRANLDVAFVQLGKDGRVLEGTKDHLELALFPESYSDATTQGWFYPKTVDVDPRAEKLRVVVRDLATGAVGSVSVPIRRLKST
jgi:VWFA-related protein